MRVRSSITGACAALAAVLAAADGSALAPPVTPAFASIPSSPWLRLAQVEIDEDPEADEEAEDLEEIDPGAEDAGEDAEAEEADDPGAAEESGDDDGDDAFGDDADDDDDSSTPARRRAAGERGTDGDEFQLAEDEIYDERGYLARRSQILALAPDDATLQAARRLGYTVADRYSLPNSGLSVVRLELGDDTSANEALKLLRAANPGSVFDYEHLYDFSPSGVQDFERHAGLSATRREALSARDDLKIGLIDSGVDAGQPEFAAARIEQRGFISTGDAPSLEHGTAVASILAGRQAGLLPRGRYYVAAVFHQTVRGGSVGAAADLVRALDWLMGHGTPVINMSLAGPPNALLEAAVARAQARGHLIVAAVGNAGPAARPQYPAAYAGVIGVTAVDERGQVYRRAGRGGHVDFAAPGVVVSAGGEAGTGQSVSGTSFAAPFVSAVLSLRYRQLDANRADQVVRELASQATDVGASGQDPVYGFGIIPLRAEL